MKINLTFKDPDGVYESLRDSVTDSLRDLDNLSQDEIDAIYEVRLENAEQVIQQWVRYGEYVTIQIDTDNESAEVLKG